MCVVKSAPISLVHHPARMVQSFAGVMTWNGWSLALRNATQLSPSAQIPMIYPYIALPVGGALVVVYALWLLFVPSAPLVAEEDEDAAY